MGRDAQPRRWPRRVRIVCGWVLVVLSVLVFFSAPDISQPRTMGCGEPAPVVLLMPSRANGDEAERAACRDRAVDQVLGTVFFIAVPAAVLLLWPRLRRTRTRMPRRPARGSPRIERAVERRRSSRSRPWFSPPAVDLQLTSDLGVRDAAERLRTLGNGGPRGALRVRITDSGYVDARIVSPASPRFLGRLVTAEDGGSVLTGSVRADPGAGMYVGMCAIGAVALGVTGVAILISNAPRGKVDWWFAAALGAAGAMGFVGVAFRRLTRRTFPVAVNGLSAALAHAMDTTAPAVPAHPLPQRAAHAIAGAFAAVQLVVVGGRAWLAGGIVAAIVVVALFACLGLVLVRVANWSRPRLDDTELRVGLRRIDLRAVNDIRARGAFMALSDGRGRVIASSALGRLDSARDAARILASPPPEASERVLAQARIVVAVGEAVARCPLDEATAAALHRPVTLPGVHRPGPRFDPLALAPLGLALTTLIASLAAIAVLH